MWSGCADHGCGYALCMNFPTVPIAQTEDKRWLTTAALAAFALPYTILFMRGDIEALLAPEGIATDDDLFKRVRQFCMLHHVRTVVSLSAASLAINTLANSAKLGV